MILTRRSNGNFNDDGLYPFFGPIYNEGFIDPPLHFKHRIAPCRAKEFKPCFKNTDKLQQTATVLHRP
jgi:hypothetical protein